MGIVFIHQWFIFMLIFRRGDFFYEMFNEIPMGEDAQKPFPGRKGDNGRMGQAGVARGISQRAGGLLRAYQ